MMEGVSWSAPAVPGSSSSLEEETHSSHILTLQMGKLRPRESSRGLRGAPSAHARPRLGPRPAPDSAAGAVGGSVQVDEKDSRAGGLAASTPMPRPPPPADFAAGAHPRRAFCAALEEREL
ncbi:unnamed protein product [Rangifer tarandus platyrhynchus]|uniref:Uncharacterized protein n=1 Tax=Rangifer tarandus platyrhynchus TaxID=3082113 RepID=A0AC59ZA51_RANTA